MSITTFEPCLSTETDKTRPGLTPIVSAALFLEAMTVSITAMAIPSMQADLGASLAVLQWTHGAFIIGFAGLLMLGGRIGDLVGRKRTFLIAAALFGIFGLAVTFAPNLMTVFIARGLQGAAAAFMIPTSIAILTHIFPEGPARNKALGTFNAAGAAGFSAGLVIGGLVIEQFGWRWAFGLNFPAAMLIVAAGALVIPTLSPEREAVGRRLDVTGAVLVGLALTSFVLALTLAAEHGVAAVEIGLIAVSAILIAAFVQVQRRASSPLVPLSLFQNTSLLRANLASLTLLGSFFGFNLLINVMLVERFELSAIQAGFVLLPMALLCVVVAQVFVAGVIDRLGTFSVGAAGLAAIAVASVLLAISGPVLSIWMIAVIAALAGGIGMGLAYAPFAIGAVSGVAPADQGVAAGLQQSTLQVGGVIGIALAVGGQSFVGAYWGGVAVSALIAGLGAVIALRR
ncbi:MAG: MFS transporter [Pseudomonadota bacterium]